MFTRQRIFIAAAVCAALVSGGAMAADTPLVIEMKDGVVSPQALTLKAGAPVTITLRNTGSSAAEFESKRLRQEIPVPPNGEISLALPALPAGTYPFVDEFHEQMDSAKGTITVE